MARSLSRSSRSISQAAGLCCESYPHHWRHGTVGRQVLSHLSALGVQTRVLTGNPEGARLPPQVEVVRGDLTLLETLDACVEGIDTVFLVWVAPPAAVAPAFERIAIHARRIVFLSALLKTAHPLFQRPNPARELARVYRPQRANTSLSRYWSGRSLCRVV